MVQHKDVFQNLADIRVMRDCQSDMSRVDSFFLLLIGHKSTHAQQIQCQIFQHRRHQHGCTLRQPKFVQPALFHFGVDTVHRKYNTGALRD